MAERSNFVQALRFALVDLDDPGPPSLRREESYDDDGTPETNVTRVYHAQ